MTAGIPERVDHADFDAYRAAWPATPPLALPERALTERFLARWVAPGASWQLPEDLTVVFARGYLGNWMPGNLVAPTRAIAASGARTLLFRGAAGASIAENAARLARSVRGDGPVLLCGHSRGGLECLLALEDPSLRARAIGVLLSQSPRGPSPVLASVLTGAHADSLGWRRAGEEALQRWGLRAARATRGGLELVEPSLPSVIARVDAAMRGVRVWQTASWSSRPTTWLDSFHARLGEIRPGAAHDGQFFLEDLLWPGLQHVLLAHVDHAQPAMGGFGFDHARYWGVLIGLFLDELTDGAGAP